MTWSCQLTGCHKNTLSPKPNSASVGDRTQGSYYTGLTECLLDFSTTISIQASITSCLIPGLERERERERERQRERAREEEEEERERDRERESIGEHREAPEVLED